MNTRFPWFVFTIAAVLVFLTIWWGIYGPAKAAAFTGFNAGLWVNLLVIKLARWHFDLELRWAAQKELREFEEAISRGNRHE